MKEEAKEIVQAVSETIKERANNPIIVTFIISWCIYNWNALFLLAFSKETIAKRIDTATLQFIEAESWLFPIFFTVGYCLISKPLNAGLRKLMEKIDHFIISLEYSKEMAKQEHEEELKILMAKAEMAYDSTKTDEKNKIQKMNEEITQSKEREGELVKDRDDAIKERNQAVLEKETALKEKIEALRRKDSLTIEINSLNDRYSEIERLLSELTLFLVKKDVDDISWNITDELYDSMKNIIKSNILNSKYIDRNENMDYISNRFSEIAISIPDIKLIYKNESAIFSKHLKLIDFINSLNLEQLMYVQRQLSK